MGVVLQAVVVGMRMDGLHPSGPVEVVEVRPLGPKARLKIRDQYGVEHALVVGDADLTEAEIAGGEIGDLRGDPARFALAADAQRILNAHLLNPLLALTTANVEPLPHQIQAVYDHLVDPTRDRFLLADDPGAGKTIMAGLFIREALARGWVSSVLIVAPGSLVDQWQEELLVKFGLDFELLDTSGDRGPAFSDQPFVIARLDQLARNADLRERMAAASYDLAIVDEAHKMSARAWGSKVMKSKRYQLGEDIRDSVDRLVLMTATPHNGKDDDFALFLELLGVSAGADEDTVLDAGLMRRLVKEQLVRADGTALFPKRHAATVGYRLGSLEADLYEAVTDYVKHEMNRVADPEERRVVGFALLVLQRRLASSTEALLRSLVRRHERLTIQLDRARASDARLLTALRASTGDLDDEWAEFWDAEADIEAGDENVATASRTPQEIETELAVLADLVDKASSVRAAGVDAKWEALEQLLLSPAMFEEDGTRRKILIFTEHRDTLEYLEDRLLTLLGRDYDVEIIHGGTPREGRLAAQDRFRSSERSAVLVATDAAGEGVNLQTAHLMVNYDIPWNPNRLEQRFGRIHRIGQRHECHLWNLVATDTREGDVFTRLLEKLERQRAALGDCVFDVLGEVLLGSNLQDLLARAVRGDASAARALESFDAQVADAVERREASHSRFTPEEIVDLRRRMALARAASLSPYVVRGFVTEAMATLQGEIVRTGAGWSVRHVPERVRREGDNLRTRYSDVEFAPVTDASRWYGARELLAPGHPLVTALARAVVGEFGEGLRRGVVLEDDRSIGTSVALWVRRRTEGREESVAVVVAGDPSGAQSSSSPMPMDPAGFASLSATGRDATATEAALVAATIASQVRADDELLAVALVRGTADMATAEAWDRSRAAVLAGDDVVAAGRAHEAWDAMVADGKAWRFVRAVPAGRGDERSSEEAPRAALDGDYQRRIG